MHVGQVSYQADVGRRVKSSFRHHIGAWLAGALVTGGFISMLPARQKKVYVNPLAKGAKSKLATAAKPSGGFFLSLLKSLLPIVKPFLTAFVTKQLANMVGGAENAQKSAEQTAKAAEGAAQAAEQTTENA